MKIIAQLCGGQVTVTEA